MLQKSLLSRTMLLILAAILTINISQSQTTLSAGDIAITGFIGDDPDVFSFVLLTDITSGTVINFTDDGWRSSGNFRQGNEGIITWTATSDLSCGTEVIITDTFPFSATTGTTTDSNFFNLNANGDQLLAFQGAATSPTFLYAVNFDGAGWSEANNSSTSAIPAGLTNGVNAVDLGEIDNGDYDCTVVSGQALILDAVSTASNWILNNLRPSSLGGCGYSCGPCSGGTTTWNGSAWDNGTPTIVTEAVINGNYNTGLSGNISSCNLTVNSGFTLTVSNSTFIEVENDAIINGSLSVQSQGNFVQNDAAGSFTNNGTTSLTKNTPVKANWFYYTYWSSPTVNASIGTLFFDVDADRRFFFNANNYLDTNGDDIDDDGNAWQFASSGATMTPGVGYAMTSSRLGLYPSSTSVTFNGAFNTGDVTVPIVHNAANVGSSWNFIGNPYPSAIDFDAFFAANSTVVDGAVYLWSQATPPDASNPGNRQRNFSQNDYATYASGMGSGTAGASGVIPTQYIPSGQGFFIPGTANGNATFTNAMRVASTSSNSQFFKQKVTKKETSSNKLWVNLTTDTGIFSQILVGYVNGASKNYDGLAYDAPRVINTNHNAVLYSLADANSMKFVIQGKSPSDLNTEETIKLGYSASINENMSYTLSIAQYEGRFLSNNSVLIKDKLLDVTHNLSNQDYTFTSASGEFNDRFEIVFSTEATLSTQSIAIEDLVNISRFNDDIQFKSKTSRFETIRIYNIQGKEVYTTKQNTNSISVPVSGFNSSIYIAKIHLVGGKTITKKIRF